MDMQTTDNLALIGGAVIYIGLMVGVAKQYESKGYSGLVGMAVALALTPILGFLIGLVMPTNAAGIEQSKLAAGKSKVCPQCAETVQAAARKCRYEVQSKGV